MRSYSHDQVVLAFSADEPASATLDIGTSDDYDFGSLTLADQVLDHEVQINGLTPGHDIFGADRHDRCHGQWSNLCR